MIMLDAGVLLAAEDSDDLHHTDARRILTAGLRLATLDLAAYEVSDVAEVRWRDPAAAARLRARVWSIETLGRLVRVDRGLADAAAGLARRHSLSVRDASYLAAAQEIGGVLVSCDQRDLVGPGHAVAPAAV